MDFKKIKLVLGREFSIRVKKKSFIITTIVTPILFAALMIVPSLIMMADLDKDVNRVMVLDDSGVVAQALESGAEIEYVIPENIDLEFAKNHLDSLGVYAVMYVSPLDTANNVTVDAYAVKQINAKVSDAIKADVNDVIERYKLQQYNIENYDRIQADLNHEVDLNTYIVGEDGQERESILGISMAISFIMGFIIYMFVTMFGNMVMTSVINEKSNKIVEVIVSSVKPFDLMIGKILGVASVALTQFFIWVILTLAIVFGFQLAMGPELMGDPEAMEQMTQMAGMDSEQMAQIASASDSETAQVFTALKEVNFGLIIGCFLIYFVLGYLLYASLFAAIGSAVDNEADTQQLQIPVTIPLLLAFFIAFYAFKAPDSQLVFWGSMIPFTSPIVMLARIPFGVPAWEIIVSVVLLLLTFAGTAWMSAKIYKIGILMFGKKTTFRDLYKWLRQK